VLAELVQVEHVSQGVNVAAMNGFLHFDVLVHK